MISEKNPDYFLKKTALSLIIGLTIVASHSLAQSSDDLEEGQVLMEDMMVSAGRDLRDLQKIPASVTKVQMEQIEAFNSGGQDIRAMSGASPSLIIESSNGRSLPRFYIRGFGNTNFSTFASQPVGLVYDDIQLSNPTLKSFPAFDLESVEVMRGPQGSLYGRNTPAGVVKLESKKPVLDSQEGYFSMSTGTYNTNNYELVFNQPVSNNAAVRVSAISQNRDDWVSNSYTGHDNSTGGYGDRAIRAQLLYQPRDSNFSGLFNVHGRDLDGTARLFRGFSLQPGSNRLAPDFDIEEIATDGHNEQQLRSSGANARLSWNLGELTLHSITGYEGINNYFSRGDIDGSNADLAAFPVESSGQINDLDQLTQEFRVASHRDAPLNWQSGVYFFSEDVTGTSRTYDTYDNGSLRTYSVNNQKTESAAVFGALDIELSDKLTTNLGARYTWTEKTFTVKELYNIDIIGPSSDSDATSKVSWDAGLNYGFSDDINGYARVATGFRAQSYAAPDTTLPITIASPEEIISYELGLKTKLFDNRVRLNLSVYQYDVDDQQLTASGGEDRILRLLNAEKSSGRGVEFDLWAHLSTNLLVTLGASYNDTELKDGNLSVGSSCGGCTILNPIDDEGQVFIDGNPLPRAADYIGNITARYDIPMGSGTNMYFYTDVSYTGEYNFNLYEAVEFTSEPLLVSGLRVGYTWDYGNYELAGFCRNCTNEIEAVGAVSINNMAGMVNEPRIVGIQFKGNF